MIKNLGESFNIELDGLIRAEQYFSARTFANDYIYLVSK